MIASGISARVTLLSHRGGWFLDDQVKKSSGMVFFDLIGTVSGVTAFIVSFLLFDWWWPLVAMAVGYWIIAPLIVSRQRFWFLYQNQFITSLVAIACSLAICELYFDVV